MKEKNVIKKLLKFWFRQKSGDGLEAKLGYQFKNPELLAHALVHRSFLTGKDLPYENNNERLEFLGDSILNMLTTEFLYKSFPDDPEGELSKRKSAIVSGHALAQSSKEWNLGEFVRIGKGEAKMGGRGKESILADAFEAVLGAVYLDSGLDQVREILERFHFPRVQSIITASDFENFKSELLEYTQGKHHTVPQYRLLSEEGPEHQKVFTVETYLGDKAYGVGRGPNKKKAEQDAARVTLDLVKKEDEEREKAKECAKEAAKAERRVPGRVYGSLSENFKGVEGK
ncbi:MAG: ribonuclease III [Fibrobacteraceae bacterium]|nr:ribonuclease III [Fibrobacteraceae bacterium]